MVKAWIRMVYMVYFLRPVSSIVCEDKTLSTLRLLLLRAATSSVIVLLNISGLTARVSNQIRVYPRSFPLMLVIGGGFQVNNIPVELLLFDVTF